MHLLIKVLDCLLVNVQEHLGTLVDVLRACLMQSNCEVAVAAMRAATAFISAIDDAKTLDRFQAHYYASLWQSQGSQVTQGGRRIFYVCGALRNTLLQL